MDEEVKLTSQEQFYLVKMFCYYRGMSNDDMPNNVYPFFVFLESQGLVNVELCKQWIKPLMAKQQQLDYMHVCLENEKDKFARTMRKKESDNERCE